MSASLPIGTEEWCGLLPDGRPVRIAKHARTGFGALRGFFVRTHMPDVIHPRDAFWDEYGKCLLGGVWRYPGDDDPAVYATADEGYQAALAAIGPTQEGSRG